MHSNEFDCANCAMRGCAKASACGHGCADCAMRTRYKECICHPSSTPRYFATTLTCAHGAIGAANRTGTLGEDRIDGRTMCPPAVAAAAIPHGAALPERAT